MNITRQDPMTGKINTLDLDVTEEELVKHSRGELAQKAFPRLNADQREFIMTGIMDWDDIFKGIPE